jgi:hypothetical protein
LSVAGSINPVPVFPGGLTTGVVVVAFLQPFIENISKEKAREEKKNLIALKNCSQKIRQTIV